MAKRDIANVFGVGLLTVGVAGTCFVKLGPAGFFAACVVLGLAWILAVSDG